MSCNVPSTHCVAAGVRTGCGLWPWCCSSSGGCGTGAGTRRSSPSSRPRWPASLWDAGGRAGAACSPDQGCCRTSPGSPGCPCTCRAQEEKCRKLDKIHAKTSTFMCPDKKKKKGCRTDSEFGHNLFWMISERERKTTESIPGNTSADYLIYASM